MTAVPLHVAQIADVDHCGVKTLRYLIAARDLELISVLEPDFSAATHRWDRRSGPRGGPISKS
jgi:hypothetical protein